VAELGTTFRPLDGPINEKFDCGAPAQNHFLLKDAWEQQQRGYSVTHLAYVKGMLAGYITLGNDVVDLTVDERPESAPAARISAVKVFQFAVDNRFKRQGLGEELLNLGMLYARENSATIGCRFLVLDAVTEKVGYYQKRGFAINETGRSKTRKQEERADPQHPATVSMRFDLRDIGDVGAGLSLPPSKRLPFVLRLARAVGFSVERLRGRLRS
jgi:ribosomal protein S18 acetylase RimI-like enzyme